MRLPVLGIVLAAGAVLTLMPGCIFLAVSGARAVDRKLNPPQKALAAHVHFFDASVVAMVRLWPVTKKSRFWMMDRGGGESETSPEALADAPTGPATSDDEAKAPHKRLFVTLLNSGTETFEVAVVELSSTLGDFVPTPAVVSLAPGQRAMLGGMASTSEPVLTTLDVTLTLRKSGKKETKILRLALPQKD